MAQGGFARDLPLRLPDVEVRQPDLAISRTEGLAGSAVTLVLGDGVPRLIGDPSRIGADGLALIAARMEHALSEEKGLSGLEQSLIFGAWNQTETCAIDTAATIHGLIEVQAQATPERVAAVFEGTRLSYAELDAQATRVAQHLTAQGAGPGARVGLYMYRSLDLLIGALGILKAGAAYVPLDPAYPADRIALFIEDSEAALILTRSDEAERLPQTDAKVIEIDTISAEQTDVASLGSATAGDLAYVIYTSGSTGRPKGVMVEHGNVTNFFTGMDDRIAGEGGTWLAVTSLSFDISVLELFWTLARGFTVVVAGDESRILADDAPVRSVGGMDFSLYYWGNDDGAGKDKYRTLLEGAKFADDNGFCAVWTPERHFHAFGGPYPNPSVTGAAVAAVTQNIGVRAGSCVARCTTPPALRKNGP